MLKLGEILGHRAEARSSAELLSHDTTRYAKLLYEPGSRPADPQHAIPLRKGGITLQDISQLAPRDVYGIQTFWQTRGLMSNSRGTVPYQTEREVESGTVYIDGRVMSRRRALRKKEKYKDELAYRMKKEGWTRVVRTRCDMSAGWKGRWKCFEKGDLVVSSKPVGRRT